MDTNCRQHTVCFTGHREIIHPNIAERLDAILIQLIEKGYCNFLAGGTLGFDTEAALSVLRLQEKHPQIKIILILPFQNQSTGWPVEQQEMYEKIKNRAAEVFYVNEKYTRGCFHIRNRKLVDNANVCIAYHMKQTGGTAYTVRYAKQKGLEIINLAD